MSAEPFFIAEGGDRFLPTEQARGRWGTNSLVGRAIVGLLGSEIEQLYGEPDFIPARLTVDMYRLPELVPVEVVVRPVRLGGRVKVIDAEFLADGVSAARATCQLLRRTESPEGRIWKAPTWDVAPPSQFETAPSREGRGPWAMRWVDGDFDSFGQRRAWISEVREMVGGRPLTPFVRVAACADFTSPFAHYSDTGLRYINSDVTLYLDRLPAGEWIGLEALNHQASEGIAVGECRLYDETGPIGAASCCALAQRRSHSAPRPAAG